MFVANTDGRPQLWLRSLGAVSVQPLAGTENAVLPFWSPDSRSIGFGADGWLKRVDLDGGVRTLASAPLFLGGAWRADGRILFTPNTFSAILSVPESGGKTTAETAPSAGLGHQFPCLLPDGRHFLFYTSGPPAVRGVYIAGSAGDSRLVLNADVPAIYAHPGRLLFVRQGTLMWQHFDPVTGALDGPVAPLVEDITTMNFSGSTILVASASTAGPDRVPDRRLTGPRQHRSALGGPDGRGPSAVRQGAVVLHQPGALAGPEARGDVRHRRHLALRSGHGRAHQFTFDPGNDFAAVWSPDGRQVVFASNRRGPYDLYLKNANGAGGESPLFQNDARKIPSDWSHDGRFLLFDTWSEKTTFDISALAMPEGKPFTVLATEFEERSGQISPDGRWLAYQSNESGRFEIRIPSVPGARYAGEERRALAVLDGRWEGRALAARREGDFLRRARRPPRCRPGAGRGGRPGANARCAGDPVLRGRPHPRRRHGAAVVLGDVRRPLPRRRSDAAPCGRSRQGAPQLEVTAGATGIRRPALADAWPAASASAATSTSTALKAGVFDLGSTSRGTSTLASG